MVDAMGTGEQQFKIEKMVDGMLAMNQFRGGITQKEMLTIMVSLSKTSAICKTAKDQFPLTNHMNLSQAEQGMSNLQHNTQECITQWMGEHHREQHVTFTKLDWDVTERIIYAEVNKTNRQIRKRLAAGEQSEDLDSNQIICLMQG